MRRWDQEYERMLWRTLRAARKERTRLRKREARYLLGALVLGALQLTIIVASAIEACH